jgi:hypothetical protein
MIPEIDFHDAISRLTWQIERRFIPSELRLIPRRPEICSRDSMTRIYNEARSLDIPARKHLCSILSPPDAATLMLIGEFLNTDTIAGYVESGHLTVGMVRPHAEYNKFNTSDRAVVSDLAAMQIIIGRALPMMPILTISFPMTKTSIDRFYSNGPESAKNRQVAVPATRFSDRFANR